MKGNWGLSFFFFGFQDSFETFGEGRSIWLIRWITPLYRGGRKAERCGGIVWGSCLSDVCAGAL